MTLKGGFKMMDTELFGLLNWVFKLKVDYELGEMQLGVASFFLILEAST